MGVSLIPSLGYGCAEQSGCNPALLHPGETYRDMIVNPSSATAAMMIRYAQAFVGRYKGSRAVLMWELGNELNLAWDGCTYDKVCVCSCLCVFMCVCACFCACL